MDPKQFARMLEMYVAGATGGKQPDPVSVTQTGPADAPTWAQRPPDQIDFPITGDEPPTPSWDPAKDPAAWDFPIGPGKPTPVYTRKQGPTASKLSGYLKHLPSTAEYPLGPLASMTGVPGLNQPNRKPAATPMTHEDREAVVAHTAATKYLMKKYGMKHEVAAETVDMLQKSDPAEFARMGATGAPEDMAKKRQRDFTANYHPASTEKYPLGPLAALMQVPGLNMRNPGANQPTPQPSNDSVFAALTGPRGK